jgi:hypothetical protein
MERNTMEGTLQRVLLQRVHRQNVLHSTGGKAAGAMGWNSFRHRRRASPELAMGSFWLKAKQFYHRCGDWQPSVDIW